VSYGDSPDSVTAFREDVDRDIFNAETWGCGRLRASARNRAISLSDKPTTFGSLVKNHCCAEVPGSSVARKEFGSKGVTICGSASMESFELGPGLDRLRLRRRFTKVRIPITAKMAATPPAMVPPTIAPIFLFRVFFFLGGDKLVVAAVPLTAIVLIGTLREGSSQE